MKEINDFLLNLFTGNDEIRPFMNFPNLKDGIVYAYDSYVLIAIPEKELSLTYNTNDSYPNAEILFLRIEKEKLTSIKVKTSDIAKELVKARLTADKYYINCKECEGNAEVEFEYIDKNSRYHSRTEECPICDGNGKFESLHIFPRVSLSMIEYKETGKQLGVIIGDLYFHPFQLYRLFMVALTKGYETIEIFYDSKNYGQTITYFGDIKVLVMAMLKPNN